MLVLKLLIKATLRQLQPGHEKSRHRWSAVPPIILSPTCRGHLERVPTGLVWGWAPGSAGPLHVSVSRKLWWEIEASRLSAHVPKVRFQTGRSLDNQIHPVCSHPTAVGFSNGFLYPSLGWPGDFLDAKVTAS